MTIKHTPTPKAKAYSYVRFSTSEQMRGDSFRRQTEAAAKYAATHGLILDDQFSFHDLGVSAFQGRNRAQGMLGEFLAFARSGDIAKGSYLLVENLDRVSRENALDALDTLKDIAREGITVVTLNDGREYTHESLRRNPMDLMVAIMMFMRANEESETKARRLREAWASKRKGAGRKPLTKLCPGWVCLREDRSGFDLLPDRAEIVRRIFRMTLAGSGQHAIAATLNREDVSVFGRGKHWQRSYIKKMLADPSTIGIFTPHKIERINGQRVRTPTEPIDGYFPAAIDRETFERVKTLTSGRAAGVRLGDREAPANILAGLAKCPLCSSTMTRVNKGRRKKGGRPYLVCTKAKAGAGCEYRQVKLDLVQDAILAGAEELVAEMPSPSGDLQAAWRSPGAEISALEDEVRRVVEAIEAAGHSRALLDRLADHERHLDDARRRLAEIEERISSTLTNRVQDIANGDLLGAVAAQDVPRINTTMRQLFERVVVDYRTGFLELDWKHAPETTGRIFFAWPTEGGR